MRVQLRVPCVHGKRLLERTNLPGNQRPRRKIPKPITVRSLSRFHVKFHLRHAPSRLEAENILVDIFRLTFKEFLPPPILLLSTQNPDGQNSSITELYSRGVGHSYFDPNYKYSKTLDLVFQIRDQDARRLD